jgi:hypothetical protein
VDAGSRKENASKMTQSLIGPDSIRTDQALTPVKERIHFHKNRSEKFNPAFFHDRVCVHGLDSYPPTPVGDIVTRFANGEG